MRGKRIILQEKSARVVTIIPNTFQGVKHSYIKYHTIPLGTQQEPKGFLLKGRALHKVERGEGHKAEVINLQFLGELTENLRGGTD